MTILLSEPGLVDDLVAFLRRCHCSADAVSARAIEAVPPHNNTDFAYRRMELDAYLRVWREMHPGVTAELLTPGTAILV